MRVGLSFSSIAPKVVHSSSIRQVAFNILLRWRRYCCKNCNNIAEYLTAGMRLFQLSQRTEKKSQQTNCLSLNRWVCTRAHIHRCLGFFFFFLHHTCDGRMIDEKALSTLKTQPGWSTGSYTEERWGKFTFQSNPSLNTCTAKTAASHVFPSC